LEHGKIIVKKIDRLGADFKGSNLTDFRRLLFKPTWNTEDGEGGIMNGASDEHRLTNND
jgi:hypothetical protein